MSSKCIAEAGNYCGIGSTFKEAYEDLCDQWDYEVEEVTFYEAKQVEVEVILQKKEVISKINREN